MAIPQCPEDGESAAPSKDERPQFLAVPLVLAWRCGLVAIPPVSGRRRVRSAKQGRAAPVLGLAARPCLARRTRGHSPVSGRRRVRSAKQGRAAPVLGLAARPCLARRTRGHSPVSGRRRVRSAKQGRADPCWLGCSSLLGAADSWPGVSARRALVSPTLSASRPGRNRWPACRMRRSGSSFVRSGHSRPQIPSSARRWRRW